MRTASDLLRTPWLTFWSSKIQFVPRRPFASLPQFVPAWSPQQKYGPKISLSHVAVRCEKYQDIHRIRRGECCAIRVNICRPPQYFKFTDQTNGRYSRTENADEGAEWERQPSWFKGRFKFSRRCLNPPTASEPAEAVKASKIEIIVQRCRRWQSFQHVKSSSLRRLYAERTAQT